MKNDQDRREFTRVPITVEVKVSDGQTTIVSDKTQDVSLTGLYLFCPESLPLGKACQVTLFLGEGQSQIHIEAKGRVIRTDDTGMGIALTEIMGADSFDHLRNLVMYNSACPNLVESEFKSHIGLNTTLSFRNS